MFGQLTCPCFSARLSWIRHGPDLPNFLSRRGVIGGDESANAFVATRGAGDHEIADNKRCSRAVIVLLPVGHFGFPQQFAVEAVESDHVRIVRQHEEAIAGDSRFCLRRKHHEILGGGSQTVDQGPGFIKRAGGTD